MPLFVVFLLEVAAKSTKAGKMPNCWRMRRFASYESASEIEKFRRVAACMQRHRFWVDIFGRKILVSVAE